MLCWIIASALSAARSPRPAISLTDSRRRSQSSRRKRSDSKRRTRAKAARRSRSRSNECGARLKSTSRAPERPLRAIPTAHPSTSAQSRSVAVDIPDSCTAHCETQDLEEMLGNILDNAYKWARSAVRVSATDTPDGIAIVVDDDGPGIAVAMRDRVLQRGVRVDETESGSGLGLAIVSDLVDLYSGSLALETAPSGGLRVQLVLPRKDSDGTRGSSRGTHAHDQRRSGAVRCSRTTANIRLDIDRSPENSDLFNSCPRNARRKTPRTSRRFSS